MSAAVANICLGIASDASTASSASTASTAVDSPTVPEASPGAANTAASTAVLCSVWLKEYQGMTRQQIREASVAELLNSIISDIQGPDAQGSVA
jgi:hypothetical protein